MGQFELDVGQNRLRVNQLGNGACVIDRSGGRQVHDDALQRPASEGHEDQMSGSEAGFKLIGHMV
jgi:hypothetical protein